MSLTINYYAAAKASVGQDSQELDFEALPETARAESPGVQWRTR